MSEITITKSSWRDYYTLCKPRVVMLMLLTAYVGMRLAVTGSLPWFTVAFGLIGIALMAGSAAVVNHLVDHRIDAIMARTKLRPIPTGKVAPLQAIIFSVILGISGFVILLCLVNWLTALLTFFTLLGYAVIYTMYLKRSTSQNIVIGGLAGAMPPMLGWVAMTGSISWDSAILVAIIFVWTPPHFWALAVYRHNEYAKIAQIPMLPITHGIEYTKTQIVLYSVAMLAVASLPYFSHLSGVIYLVGSSILGLVFLYYAIRMKLSDDISWGRTLFRYSILYLLLLFVLLLADHSIL